MSRSWFVTVRFRCAWFAFDAPEARASWTQAAYVSAPICPCARAACRARRAARDLRRQCRVVRRCWALTVTVLMLVTALVSGTTEAPCVRIVVALETISIPVGRAPTIRSVSSPSIRCGSPTHARAGRTSVAVSSRSPPCGTRRSGAVRRARSALPRARGRSAPPGSIDWTTADRATATGASLNVPDRRRDPFLRLHSRAYGFLHHGKDVGDPRAARRSRCSRG